MAFLGSGSIPTDSGGTYAHSRKQSEMYFFIIIRKQIMETIWILYKRERDRLLLSINSKGSFICTIPQTG